MSNSTLSSTPYPARLPTEHAISQCLYGVVRLALKDGEEITTRQARARAEAELGLDAGFFKDHATWNLKSKQILQDAIDAPPTPAKPAGAKKVATKRKSDEAHPAKKRQKKAAVADIDEDENEDEDHGVDPASDHDESPNPKQKSAASVQTKRRSTTAQPKAQSRKKPSSDESASEDEDSPRPTKKRGSSKAKQSTKRSKKSSAAISDEDEDRYDDRPNPSEDGVRVADVDNTHSEDDVVESTKDGTHSPGIETGKLNGHVDDTGEESEYSVVLDEAPAKKSRAKKSSSSNDTKSKTKKPVKPKADTKGHSPDDEEIKRLQGWLVKCGIRKLWHKELAGCSTSGQKIKHLKTMLSEAGMTGRYSTEKAKSIKEARELADEIKAAQDFNRKWGEKSGDEDEDDVEEDSEGEEESKSIAPPAKRLPKGLVDFGDDDDSE